MTRKRSASKSICPAARAARLPSIIKPMLATLVDEPFSDPDWIFETKWDGYRSVCFLKNGSARFVSRNQIEMTPQYPELANIGKQLRAKEAILDGEICALDRHGIPRFQMLQRKGAAQRPPIVYFVFDLLYLDGYDLTSCTVVERKARLAEIIQPSNVIKLSEHIEGDGEAFFREVARFKLEGMMAKRAGSKYVQKRSSDWLKIKTVMRQEVVIGGYTQPRGGRSHFGALVCGLYRGDELHYVAHTGGGFNEKLLASIYKLMQPLKIDKSPFVAVPKTNEPVQWIKPKLVGEVKFSEWTADNHLRHPVFVGMREDKDPKDCRFEFQSDTDDVVEKVRKRRKKNPL
jgi:bifunctional non-homologous end joining protein LigD